MANIPWDAFAQLEDIAGNPIFRGPLAEVVRSFRDTGDVEKWAAQQLICDEEISFPEWPAGRKSIAPTDVERLAVLLP